MQKASWFAECRTICRGLSEIHSQMSAANCPSSLHCCHFLFNGYPDFDGPLQFSVVSKAAAVVTVAAAVAVVVAAAAATRFLVPPPLPFGFAPRLPTTVLYNDPLGA